MERFEGQHTCLESKMPRQRTAIEPKIWKSKTESFSITVVRKMCVVVPHHLGKGSPLARSPLHPLRPSDEGFGIEPTLRRANVCAV